MNFTPSVGVTAPTHKRGSSLKDQLPGSELNNGQYETALGAPQQI